MAETARSVAAGIKRAVSAWKAVGEKNAWQPAEGACGYWRDIDRDPMALTLTEADLHASLLAQSSIEHALAMTRAISAGGTTTPITIGRTALEHGVRSVHLTDANAPDAERAERMLQELFYAVREADYRSVALSKTTLLDGEPEPPPAETKESVRKRAETIGVHVSNGGRQDTIALAEKYLADGVSHAGLPKFLMQTFAAAVHGTEHGLMFLAGAAGTVGPANVLVLERQTPESLAFGLGITTLAPLNAVRSLGHRFQWRDDATAQRAAKETDHMIRVLREAVGEQAT